MVKTNKKKLFNDLSFYRRTFKKRFNYDTNNDNNNDNNDNHSK